MLIDYLEDLRQKPKDVRTRYTILISAVITGVVVLIWLLGLFITNYGKRGSDAVIEVDVSEQQVKTTTELFNEANPFKDGAEGSFQESQNIWAQELRSLETQTNTPTGATTSQRYTYPATSTSVR